MIRVNLKPVELTINSITDLLANTKPVLTEVGAFAELLIKERTARGVDWRGIKFKNYNKFYAGKRKDKRLPTSHVDLFFTGHMMGAMKTKVNGNTARVYFASKLESDKVLKHNVGAGVPERHFFDLTPSNVADAQQIITDWFDHGLK